jgi:hypothetical protein
MHTMRLFLHSALSLALVTFGFARTAGAQMVGNGIEATGFFGYQLSPTIDGTTSTGAKSYLNIADSVVYGASIGRQLRPGVRTELSWRFQPTHVTSTPATGEATSFDLAVHYFHAVASYERGNEKVQGFALLGLGGTLTHPVGVVYDDAWFWSFAFALGLKVRFNDRFGLRAESRLGVPFRFDSGGIWCGGGGCVVALSGGHAIAQIDFVVGPVLSF